MENEDLVPKATLRVWEGDFGLPSVDPTCLRILTYIKINKIDVKIKYANVPQWKLIPSLEYKKNLITDYAKIMEQLSKFCVATDVQLQPKESGRKLKVYTEHCEVQLGPAVLIDEWMDADNLKKVTRVWYSHAIPFPFGSMYINKRVAEVELQMKSMVVVGEGHNFTEMQYSNAKACVSDIASWVHEREFLLGRTATSLDATVYGFLAPALFAPRINSHLKNIVTKYPGLVAYIEHVTHTFFPNTVKTYKYVKNPNEILVTQDGASGKTILLTTILVATVMIIYGVRNNIISVKH